MDDIQFEDTIVIRQKGSALPGKVIKIRDAQTLDEIRNSIAINKYEIYK
jgi:hypothetical protein